LKSVHYKVS